MKNKVAKLYVYQLAFSFIAVVVITNTRTLLVDVDTYSGARIGLMSLVYAFLFTLLNAFLNAFNFFYTNDKRPQYAFLIPAALWIIILLYVLYQKSFENSKFWSRNLDLIIWVLPILYNLSARYFLKKTKIV